MVEEPGSSPDPSWHSRGYVPHCEHPRAIQFVTYRLADSIPRRLMLRNGGEPFSPEGDTAYRRRLEACLDEGMGVCHLRDPEIARMVMESLRHFEGERYRLHAWVVMPNHVHVLARIHAPYTLAGVVKTWKGYVGRKANELLGRRGAFWQKEYWDRYVRDLAHYRKCREYVRENPAKAGIIPGEAAWRWEWACDGDEAGAYWADTDALPPGGGLGRGEA